jgi:hypothetical protein
LAALVAHPLPGAPQDFSANIDAQETKWSRIVRLPGAKAA